MATVEFSRNSCTSFPPSNNHSYNVYSCGGAVFGTIQIKENATVVFNGNSCISNGNASHHFYSYGGAVCGDVKIEKGATVVFSQNTSSSHGSSLGGAIFADNVSSFSGEVSLAGNVKFEDNLTLESNVVSGQGGAIWARTISFNAIDTTEKISFLRNKSGYGGAIYVETTLTASSTSNITFSENEATEFGGAIYSTNKLALAGTIHLQDNIASKNGGAISAERTFTCFGDTTKITFSGNKVGSDAKGWTNNDILLVKAISSMTIRDAGTYEFGGGIYASAGGALSISEANVTFQSGSVTKLGGATTISDGATVTLGAGTTFDLVAGATLSVGDASVVKLHTNLSEATVITVASGASVTFAETAKLIIDVAAATTMLAETDGNALLGDVAKIAIIRANDETGIGDLGAIELLVDGVAFNGEWNTLQEADTLYLTMAIPEPSMFGLLAGLGALTLACARRRRN